MYLPAFPSIADVFHTPVANVAMSLSSYFIGLAVGQILYGPLLDRFGRKRPIICGLALYILASLACTASDSIETLIALRFVQAIGGCAAGVGSMAMVRDFFAVKESAKVFSLLILILGASPLLAPTIGGYVTAHLQWTAVFYILAAMGAALLAVVAFILPEGHTPDPTVSLKPGPIFRGFMEILYEPQFYTYTFTGALAFSGLFVYVAGSPIIFMGIFGVSGQVYSWIFAGLSVGFIGASQFNIYLLRKFSNEQILKTAILMQLATGVIFFLGVATGSFGLFATIVCFFFYLASVGLSNPNAGALALAPFTRNVGSAAALMGAIQIAAGALASFAVGLFSASSHLPITIIMATSSAFALTMLLVGRSRIVNPVIAAPAAETVVTH